MHTPELLAPAGTADQLKTAFAYGADAVYAGRCLLSGHMNHRDANQGACTNACRWNYKEVSHSHDQTGDLIATLTNGEVQTAEPRGNPAGRAQPPWQLHSCL